MLVKIKPKDQAEIDRLRTLLANYEHNAEIIRKKLSLLITKTTES